MLLHDYSNLLKAIDNAQLEEKKLNNQILANNKNELAELEMEIVQSGILDDWFQLNEAMKKLGVRGFPYPSIKGEGSKANNFTDGYRFMETKSSGSHWHDQFGIDGFNIGERKGWSRDKVNWVVTHVGGSGLWNWFSGEDAEAKETTCKIRMLKEFREAYPVYKEFKLREIYEALGKQMEKNEKLREML